MTENAERPAPSPERIAEIRAWLSPPAEPETVQYAFRDMNDIDEELLTALDAAIERADRAEHLEADAKEHLVAQQRRADRQTERAETAEAANLAYRNQENELRDIYSCNAAIDLISVAREGARLARMLEPARRQASDERARADWATGRAEKAEAEILLCRNALDSEKGAYDSARDTVAAERAQADVAKAALLEIQQVVAAYLGNRLPAAAGWAAMRAAIAATPAQLAAHYDARLLRAAATHIEHVARQDGFSFQGLYSRHFAKVLCALADKRERGA